MSAEQEPRQALRAERDRIDRERLEQGVRLREHLAASAQANLEQARSLAARLADARRQK